MLGTDTILQHRYRILRPLGRGGMGAVYEATDLRLHRTVALKETLVETEELRRAFEREARLLANLRHPALPKVLDHFSEDAGLFLVMEFIPGDDLGVMLEQGRRFASGEVLRWGEQLLHALEYLHALDPPVLHRDIKPSNLKLIAPEQIVLLDFGLAKGSVGQMTRSGNSSILGYSPNYSSLEQVQGAGTDARSDLYSLGATLYHLLTGVKPPDALARASAILHGQVDPLLPPYVVRAEVPRAAAAALLRALALNIEQRPLSAAEMRADLLRSLPEASATTPISEADEVTQVRSMPGRDTTSQTGIGDNRAYERRQVVVPLPEETWVAKTERRSKRGLGIGISLTALLLTVSAALYWFYPGAEEQRPAPAPSPVAQSSPLPSPSPSPSENSISPPGLSPAELVARAELARRNIPYTEAAFTQAVERGDTRAVELFLTAGMRPDVTDSMGQTPLIIAASRGRNNISQQLLSRGATANASDHAGTTALMVAAQNDHRQTAQVLLEHGADANLRDNAGQTALMRAAAQGHSRIARMLLERGARADLKDQQGRDALQWAEINNHADVINLLRRQRVAAP